MSCAEEAISAKIELGCGAQQTPGGDTVSALGHHLLVPPGLADAYGCISCTRCSLYVLLRHGAPAVLMGVIPMCFQWRQLALPLVWHNRVPWLLHCKEVMATLCLFQSSNICHNYFLKYFLSEFTGGTQGLTPVPQNEEKRGTRFHIVLHALCCNRFWHTVISKTQEEVCIRLQAATRQSQYLHWDTPANSRICCCSFLFCAKWSDIVGVWKARNSSLEMGWES